MTFTFFTKKTTLFSLVGVIVIATSTSVLITKPKTAEAQISSAACNTQMSYSNAVPVYDKATAALKDVKCKWDGIAWQMAQVVLQELTSSVVNWINSGFEGSPAFLTNPEGFFLDAADQATGAFIANAGPLSGLCSPFSLDIRLSLALGQASTYNRYTCTLGTIIKNSRGGGGVNVSVDQSPNGATLGDITSGDVLNKSGAISVNGSSVNGFMSGDYSQGGLPAFLALTTEPQNNAFGASLQAQSDLQMRVLAKQNAINNDLNRGGGFLSWQKCQNVPDSSGGGSSASRQVCRTETPGSVISASLNKELGVPTDRLNLTNSINQIVSALFSQLITRVLSGGLHSSSQTSSSGSTPSYVSQLTNDKQLQDNFISLRQQVVSDFKNSAASMKQASDYRNQALATVVTIQDNYIAARACLSNKIGLGGNSGNVSYLQSQLTAINNAISVNVTPQVLKYQTLADQASSAITQIDVMAYDLEQTKSAADLTSMSATYTNNLSSQTTVATDIQAAKSDLAAAETLSKELHTALTPYQNACSGVTGMY